MPLFSVFLLPIALVVATSAASPVASVDDAASLLAKHRAYVGWALGDNAMATMKLVFQFTDPGSPASQAKSSSAGRSDVLVSGSRYRDFVAASPSVMQRLSGFDGDAFWRANFNDNVVKLTASRARCEVTWSAVWREGTSALAGTVRGSAVVRDTPTTIVRVIPAGGDPADLYVDPATGAYRRVVISPGTREANTIEIDRYDEAVPGKRILAAYHAPGGTLYSLAHAEIGGTVTDADVMPPKPRITWTFASSDPIPIQIRAHSLQVGPSGSAVLVNASVDGHQGLFLIDSGTSSIVLDSAFASFLHPGDVGSATYLGANGGRMSSYLARVRDFAFGANVMHDAIVAVGSLGAVANGGVNGIIGYDFFAQALVDVDLDAKQLTIYDPAHFAPSGGAGTHVLDVDLSTLTPQVDITIDGKYSAHPTIDSGSDLYVILSNSLHRKGVAPLLDLASVYFGGVDGSAQIPAPCGRISEIRLESIHYVRAPTCFGPESAFGDDGGLIGFDFLRHFNWTFDYPDGRLVLTQNSSH